MLCSMAVKNPRVLLSQGKSSLEGCSESLELVDFCEDEGLLLPFSYRNCSCGERLTAPCPWLRSVTAHCSSPQSLSVELSCLIISVFSFYTSCVRKSGNSLVEFVEGFQKSWTTSSPCSCPGFFLESCSSQICFFTGAKAWFSAIFLSDTSIMCVTVPPLFLQEMGTAGHCNCPHF